mmetsp:Transcript_33299/g.94347  ORF Transcript_33299/g.94347 Transcript_33299/m.94347 type:complete len:517 (-) Transcript_33299:1933-3483(-)
MLVDHQVVGRRCPLGGSGHAVVAQSPVNRLEDAGRPAQPPKVAAPRAADVGVVVLPVAAHACTKAEVVQALLERDAGRADRLEVPTLGAVEFDHQHPGVQVLHKEGVGLEDVLNGVVVLRHARGHHRCGLGLVLEEVEGEEGGRVTAHGILVQDRAGQVQLEYILVRLQVRQLFVQVDSNAAVGNRAPHSALLPALGVGISELGLQLADTLLQALDLPVPQAASVRKLALAVLEGALVVGAQLLHLRLQRQRALLLVLQQLPHLVQLCLVFVPHIAQVLQLTVHVRTAPRRPRAPISFAALPRAVKALRHCVIARCAVIYVEPCHHRLQVHLGLAELPLQALVFCPQLRHLSRPGRGVDPPQMCQLLASISLAGLGIGLRLAHLQKLCLEVAQLLHRSVGGIKNVGKGLSILLLKLHHLLSSLVQLGLKLAVLGALNAPEFLVLLHAEACLALLVELAVDLVQLVDNSRVVRPQRVQTRLGIQPSLPQLFHLVPRILQFRADVLAHTPPKVSRVGP